MTDSEAEEIITLQDLKFKYSDSEGPNVVFVKPVKNSITTKCLKFGSSCEVEYRVNEKPDHEDQIFYVGLSSRMSKPKKYYQPENETEFFFKYYSDGDCICGNFPTLGKGESLGDRKFDKRQVIGTNELFGEGSKISITVDGESKQVVLQKDFNEVYRWNCKGEIPKKLFLVVGVYNTHGHCPPDGGTLSLQILRISVDKIDLKDTLSDSDERLDFVREQFTDFEIPLRNKTIRVPKGLIKKPENISRLSNLSFEIDDTNVLNLLVGKRLQEREGEEDFIPLNHLQDYFMFFKILGCQVPMMNICYRIGNIRTFREGYLIFRDFCKHQENDAIKSWFGVSSNKNKEEADDDDDKIIFSRTTFNHSFSLALFNRLLFILDNIVKDYHDVLGIDISVGYILFHLRKYEEEVNSEIIEVSHHLDFANFSGSESIHYDRENRSAGTEDSTNIIIVSKEGKEFRVHREVIVLQFNFFHLMFRFRGAEIEEYERSGRIQMQDLTEDVLDILFLYAYTGHINFTWSSVQMAVSEVVTLIRLVAHAHQFSEDVLLSKLLKILRNEVLKNERTMGLLCSSTLDPSSSSSPIQIVVEKVGFLLHENTVLCEYVLPVLRAMADEDENFVPGILKMLIETSFNKYQQGGKEDKEKMVDEDEEDIRKENEVLKALVKKLKKQVAVLKDDVKMSGTPVIRKRENDDEEVEKEYPKKRRKIQ